MKLDVYGKRIEIIYENSAWSIYVLGEGKKLKTNDICIPDNYNEKQAIQFLEDLFHEKATKENPNIIVLEEDKNN